MNAGEPFYVRRAINELRAIFRKDKEFKHSGKLNDLTISLFIKLADDLAQRAGNDYDNAYAFVIRCMGIIAKSEAKNIYNSYGYINPFEPSSLDSQKIDEPLWKWPLVNTASSLQSGIDSDVFREFSALKMFGYTVGKKDGWPRQKREAFLADFMRNNLPPIVVQTFGHEYGLPMSTQRLRKIANIIATNASNFHRNDPLRYKTAISDWESDLAYLYSIFYIKEGLAFRPWPEITKR